MDPACDARSLCLFTEFDAGSMILLGCLAVIGHILPLFKSRRGQALAGVGAFAVIAGSRLICGAPVGLDTSATLVLVWTAVGLGRVVITRGAWPAGAMAVALAVVTAAGTYLRTYRLSEVMHAPDRALQPDVRYYRDQSLRTFNPFAAGTKSPLWPALNAPIVRAARDTDTSIRVLSWCCGIAMLPLAGWALGRLLHPLAGVLTAGTLAVEPWLIDLCCEGLREEAGVCVWMILLMLLFAGPDTKGRLLAAGITGGALLLLRNTFLLPLIVLLVWAVVYRRWSKVRSATVLLIPFLMVAPFYVNQYRTFGDAFALEKRDARYHANIEFGSTPPPGLAMPSPQERSRDVYAGEPLSPLTYLFGHHSWADVAGRQWTGLSRIIRGQPFSSLFGAWFSLAGAAGVVASLAVRRARFAGLFVIASSAGMLAHLLTVHPLELRLLLPVMTVWIASAWWLIVSVVQAGIERARNQTS